MTPSCCSVALLLSHLCLLIPVKTKSPSYLQTGLCQSQRVTQSHLVFQVCSGYRARLNNYTALINSFKADMRTASSKQVLSFWGYSALISQTQPLKMPSVILRRGRSCSLSAEKSTIHKAPFFSNSFFIAYFSSTSVILFHRQGIILVFMTRTSFL